MLCRAPERFGILQRSVIDEPVCLEDIMPTILDMAGLPIPESVDGRSLYPLMRGERPDWRHHLHIEHSPIHQTLTDGREKLIWYVADGRELFFDLRNDPNELCNRINDPSVAGRVEEWRRLLIEELADRPEGFTDGEKLIAGRHYGATLPHAGGSV